tara:strand:- start:198 stop:452 length:255 start_codon:yes stop_codon:yes gene_type:complete
MKKMEIFLLFSIIILMIFFIFKKVYYSAKINLFKDQAAWSGKDIKIIHRESKQVTESKKNNNYLNKIAEESKVYLEDQYKQEQE